MFSVKLMIAYNTDISQAHW